MYMATTRKIGSERRPKYLEVNPLLTQRTRKAGRRHRSLTTALVRPAQGATPSVTSSLITWWSVSLGEAEASCCDATPGPCS